MTSGGALHAQTVNSCGLVLGIALANLGRDLLLYNCSPEARMRVESSIEKIDSLSGSNGSNPPINHYDFHQLLDILNCNAYEGKRDFTPSIYSLLNNVN